VPRYHDARRSVQLAEPHRHGPDVRAPRPEMEPAHAKFFFAPAALRSAPPSRDASSTSTPTRLARAEPGTSSLCFSSLKFLLNGSHPLRSAPRRTCARPPISAPVTGEPTWTTPQNPLGALQPIRQLCLLLVLHYPHRSASTCTQVTALLPHYSSCLLHRYTID
jgi:hypothetical protein